MRTLTPLLVILLLLNVFGYYAVFLGWKYTNDLSMMERLDAENYEDSETITLRIPFAIPYATDSRDYERVNGEFEHNGEFYRLVKQKLLQDTLYIVCIKDHENRGIHHALSHLAQSFSGTPSELPSNLKTTVSFIKDYVVQPFSISNVTSGWAIDILKATPTKTFTPSFLSSVIHPPE